LRILIERARRLTGWARVELLGMLTRKEILALLEKANIGLVLYQPAPNHDEAGPHKFFEYMAAGIPFVASDFPLWRGIVERGGCGLVANPQDTATIANAIEYLLKHLVEATCMGMNSRRAFEQRYNWEAEEPTLLNLYETILTNTN